MPNVQLDPRRLASLIIGLEAMRAELATQVDDKIGGHLFNAIEELGKAHEALDHQSHYFEVPKDYHPPKGTCGGQKK